MNKTTAIFLSVIICAVSVPLLITGINGLIIGGEGSVWWITTIILALYSLVMSIVNIIRAIRS